MKYGMPLGVYSPGRSWLHRCPAGPKIVGLIVFILIVVFAARTLLTVGIAAAITAAAFLLARIPLRTAAGQVLPPIPIVAFFAAVQWWYNGRDAGLVLFISLMTTIAAATLLTLTTRIAEVMDAIEEGLRPLSRFGVPADTISLAMSLTLRLIPLQLATVREVLQARAARGASMSMSAFGIPVVVRSIRRARALGEALVARGVGE